MPAPTEPRIKRKGGNMVSRKKPALNWAPMSGQWKINTKNTEYIAPDDAKYQAGIALSTARVRNGQVSVKVCLNDADKNAGRILIGYNTVTGAYYSIGLAGYGYAYVIDEFVPGQAWRAIEAKGNKSQLDGKHMYKIIVEIHGQNVTLIVDGIRIMDHTLPSPLGGSQAGLFAWGPGSVTFNDFEWSGDDPRAFVIMQFSEPFDSLFKEVVVPICKKAGFDAFRVDDVFGPGIILQDIIQALIASDVIIAEISTSNPNVFYELGYAHALEKPTILLANRDSLLPFDISGYRVIFYDNTIGGKPEVESTLEKHLKNILIGRVS